VTSAQQKSASVQPFSAALGEIPANKSINSSATETKRESISLDQTIDSVQSLDTQASDKEVVFLVLPGLAQIFGLPIPVGTVANNLWNAGQKVAVFTLNSNSPDYNKLVQRFAIKSFPTVVILGRQGSASALTGEITEARLYNAFVLASQPAGCCPGQGNATCCTPGNPACCPK
jgi:hypothetical protein